jgi:hypothetical protein
MDPIRVSMIIKDTGACTGVIYKRVFDSTDTGVVTQLWIKFDNDLVADKYIKDECITFFDVIHPHREGVFEGNAWVNDLSVRTGC